MSPDPTDAELLARLRAADPASELPPADPAEVDRVLQRVIDVDLRETGTRKRNRLTWLVAAAAAIVIAAGGSALWLSQSDRPRSGGVLVTGPSPTSATHGPGAVSELTVSPAAGRCVVPTSEALAATPIAFKGTVLGVADGIATIRPTTVYAGQVADQVTVSGAVAPETEGGREGDPAFVAGQDYLVAADGRSMVLGCGMSGPASPELTRLYAQAFGR
ncbi:hypothetical protein JCM18899A_03690 [Nocardioides sp. AN3]